MLGDNHLHIGRGVASTWKNESLTSLLSHLNPIISGDVILGNLECVLGKPISLNPRRRIYLASSEKAKELKELGFTHLNLANNHILEHGCNSALITNKLLASEGIRTCGLVNPRSSTIADQTIEIYGFSLVKERYPNDFYKNQITNDDLCKIQYSEANYKIVTIHWGDEYSNYPSSQQIELGHELIKRGVSLILGHHPHVIQGIEMKNGSLIAYSLGNFIFDQNWSEDTKTGLILNAYLKNGTVNAFDTFLVKQDNKYIPNLSKSHSYSHILQNFSKYYQKDNEYRNYVKERNHWARYKMKEEVFFHLPKVSFSTMLIPIFKRVPAIEKILFPNEI